MDQAAANMRALRDATGNYAAIPGTIYYKYTVDNTISTGERVLTIYGLNPGETDDKIATDAGGGWTKKVWTNAITGSDYYLSENFITNMYRGNPDKKQLLPIMHQIISVSNGSLTNDYGYEN